MFSHGILALALLSLMSANMDPQKNPKAVKAFSFSGTDYYARFSKDNLHEFTPKSQPDLKKWTDMVTINDYPDAKDGDKLAAMANGVLENYKAHKAVIVRTDSIPRTETKAAEHLIVVLFPQPTFIEAAFARFVLRDGVGASVVYSHRIYSKKAGDTMSKWLQANGPKIEKELMAWSIPKP